MFGPSQLMIQYTFYCRYFQPSTLFTPENEQMSPQQKKWLVQMYFLWAVTLPLPVIYKFYKPPKLPPFFANQPTAPVKNSPSLQVVSRAR